MFMGQGAWALGFPGAQQETTPSCSILGGLSCRRGGGAWQACANPGGWPGMGWVGGEHSSWSEPSAPLNTGGTWGWEVRRGLLPFNFKLHYPGWALVRASVEEG